jgi:hypothetical protein
MSAMKHVTSTLRDSEKLEEMALLLKYPDQ